MFKRPLCTLPILPALMVIAVRRFHDAGLDHRNLKLGKLLLQAKDGGRTRTWVCDLDGARLASRLERGRAAGRGRILLHRAGWRR
jgi:hypothetical protein